MFFSVFSSLLQKGGGGGGVQGNFCAIPHESCLLPYTFERDSAFTGGGGSREHQCDVLCLLVPSSHAALPPQKRSAGRVLVHCFWPSLNPCVLERLPRSINLSSNFICNSMSQRFLQILNTFFRFSQICGKQETLKDAHK